MNAQNHSRYPRSITILMGSLVILGFFVAIFGSTKLMVIFGVIYVACFLAWAAMAGETEGDR